MRVIVCKQLTTYNVEICKCAFTYIPFEQTDFVQIYAKPKSGNIIWITRAREPLMKVITVLPFHTSSSMHLLTDVFPQKHNSSPKENMIK